MRRDRRLEGNGNWSCCSSPAVRAIICCTEVEGEIVVNLVILIPMRTAVVRIATPVKTTVVTIDLVSISDAGRVGFHGHDARHEGNSKRFLK